MAFSSATVAHAHQLVAQRDQLEKQIKEVNEALMAVRKSICSGLLVLTSTISNSKKTSGWMDTSSTAMVSRETTSMCTKCAHCATKWPVTFFLFYFILFYFWISNPTCVQRIGLLFDHKELTKQIEAALSNVHEEQRSSNVSTPQQSTCQPKKETNRCVWFCLSPFALRNCARCRTRLTCTQGRFSQGRSSDPLRSRRRCQPPEPPGSRRTDGRLRGQDDHGRCRTIGIGTCGPSANARQVERPWSPRVPCSSLQALALPKPILLLFRFCNFFFIFYTAIIPSTTTTGD